MYLAQFVSPQEIRETIKAGNNVRKMTQILREMPKMLSGIRSPFVFQL